MLVIRRQPSGSKPGTDLEARFNCNRQPEVKVFDDLIEGAAPKVVRIERGQPLAGELSAALKPAEPFKWLGAK